MKRPDSTDTTAAKAAWMNAELVDRLTSEPTPGVIYAPKDASPARTPARAELTPAGARRVSPKREDADT